MRRFISGGLAGVLALTGCYSSSSVPAGSLGRLHVGGKGGGTVVTADDGEPVRLDPNSEIRFTRTDATTTRWFSVSELQVNDEGVFVLRDVPPAELHSATVEGLTPAEIALFDRTRPAYADVRVVGTDKIEIHGGEASLAGWIEVLEKAASDLPGRWTFHLVPDTGPYAGESLLAAAKHGVHVTDGLRWSAVDSAEIRNLHHGHTAIAIVAVTALVIGLVAVASASKGNANVGKIFEGLGRGAVEGVRVVSHVHVSGGGGGGGTADHVVDGTPEESSTLGSGAAPPNADGARPLFGGVARRRSVVGFVGALDGQRELWSLGRTHAGFSASLRLVDFVELGGGARYIASGARSDLLYFGRMGIHAGLDAARRFAFPFAVEMGGGGDVALYTRLAFGLRVRVDEHWSLGLYAFNPTFARYRTTDVPRWSFPSGVEASFAF